MYNNNDIYNNNDNDIYNNNNNINIQPTLVTVLQLDGEANSILHAISAPCRPDAALDGPEGLAVSVAGFEPCRTELGPDGGQLTIGGWDRGGGGGMVMDKKNVSR